MMNELVKQEIAKRLCKVPAPELDQQIRSGYDLVGDLEPYKVQLKMAKAFVDPHIEPNELLDWLLQNRPSHGVVLFNHRTWYNQQVAAVNEYLDNL